MAKQQVNRRRRSSAPSAHAQARILAEALPHMQRYDRQTVVVKYGGHAMGDPALAAAFAQDIVLLKQAGVNPIVVHGGGPQIAGMLKRLELIAGALAFLGDNGHHIWSVCSIWST